MQQKLHAYAQHRDHARLEHLACRRISKPFPRFLLCRLRLFRFAVPVPVVLRDHVLHAGCPDLRVLLALGAEHHQKLYHLVFVALHPGALHRGVVGLRALHHPLELFVHRRPVRLAVRHLRALAELRRVVLHIVFAPRPQRRHRDLVHLGNTARPQAHRRVRRVHRRAQCFIVAVPRRIVCALKNVLLRACTAQLRMPCSPQPVLQQFLSVLCHPRLDLRQAALHIHAKKPDNISRVKQILSKLHRRRAGAPPAQLCRCRG